MRNVTDPNERWRRAAEGLNLRLPPERIEAVGPILSDLERRVRVALDRDLSLVEPAHEFQPEGE